MSVSGIEGGVGAAAQAIDKTGGDTSQTLFEAMAQNAHAHQDGMGASELGNTLMNNMRGFVERNHDFSQVDLDNALSKTQDANAPHKISDIPPTSGTSPNDTNGAGLPDDKTSGDMDLALRSMDALQDSYSHAIEIGLVSRGATQASGAVRSLLRGQ